MGLRFINYPEFIPKDAYDKLACRVAEKLLRSKSVCSVYQMGSVKNPGISDLDIIAIFNDGSACDVNIQEGLSGQDSLILTHGSFGIPRSKINLSQSYNFLTNLNLLGGEDLHLLEEPDSEMLKELKVQIALEYMLKMYITLDAQITFGIIKLRSFLLQAKAIIFDLELLGIRDGELYNIVMKVIEIRNNWFNKAPELSELQNLVVSFQKELKTVLDEMFHDSVYSLPSEKLKITRNMSIQMGDSFLRTHKGVVLPAFFSFFGKKYVNVQNRINSFEYTVPYTLPEADSLIAKRALFFNELVDINKNNYPGFIPTTTSLNAYN